MQYTLISSHKPDKAKVVNVASVPQRSPFRYPGGKTWFIPRLRQWIRSQPGRPKLLVEPFAGGGIVSLTAVFENLVDIALMAELDEEIAAVWQLVVDGDSEWLAERIMGFPMTRENAIRELSKKSRETREIAFRTIIKNRTFHGGILAAGSGLLKNGEAGKGVLSRWYPATLAQRFRDIDSMRKRLQFKNADALEVLKKHRNADAIFFIDPPYTAGGKKAGKRLYKYYALNHELLFRCCCNLKGDFIMTYDNADEVKDLAMRHGLAARLIPMKNTHHAEMKELVIGRNLDWLEDAERVAEKTLPICPRTKAGKPRTSVK